MTNEILRENMMNLSMKGAPALTRADAEKHGYLSNLGKKEFAWDQRGEQYWWHSKYQGAYEDWMIPFLELRSHLLELDGREVFMDILSDGKLRETQTANYFSNFYLIDCAVLSVNARSYR